MITSILKLIRPQQWTKNGFVFAGLLFDEAWTNTDLVIDVVITFFAFCLISSSVYVLNDWADREEDRRHPTKKHRPIAAGVISPGLALTLFAVLAAASLTLGAVFVSVEVALFLALYLTLNIGYSFGLKRVVILDVFIIASGFLLRILAGTIGVGMEPSEWLFLCSLCLTLFLGFGKRRAELSDAEVAANGESDAPTRKVLGEYSPVLLDSMMSAVAACTFVSYGLFTVSAQTVERHGTTALVYTLPFVMYAMFRYFYTMHQRGKGGDPSEELVRDPHIVLSGLGWLVTTFLIIS